MIWSWSPACLATPLREKHHRLNAISTILFSSMAHNSITLVQELTNLMFLFWFTSKDNSKGLLKLELYQLRLLLNWKTLLVKRIFRFWTVVRLCICWNFGIFFSLRCPNHQFFDNGLIVRDTSAFLLEWKPQVSPWTRNIHRDDYSWQCFDWLNLTKPEQLDY